MKPPPLEQILAWHETVASTPRENLAFSVLAMAGKFDHFPPETLSVFRAWLTEELDLFQQVGRTVQVRGLIDYVFHREGNSKEWDDGLDRKLDMLERADVPQHLKPLINKAIPNLIARKPEWLEASRSWRDLRYAHLTDEALHVWEDEMTLRQQPGI